MNEIMVEFIFKHPIIAFLMIDAICDCVKYLIKRSSYVVVESVETIKRRIDKEEEKKTTIGFKYIKEES